MRDENCGVVPVVDAVGRLEGILTDCDIVVRGLIDESTLRRIEDVMTDDVSAVTEDEPLTSVLDLMEESRFRRVPVVTATTGCSASSAWRTSPTAPTTTRICRTRSSGSRPGARSGACSAEAVAVGGAGDVCPGRRRGQGSRAVASPGRPARPRALVVAGEGLRPSIVRSATDTSLLLGSTVPGVQRARWGPPGRSASLGPAMRARVSSAFVVCSLFVG